MLFLQRVKLKILEKERMRGDYLNVFEKSSNSFLIKHSHNILFLKCNQKDTLP